MTPPPVPPESQDQPHQRDLSTTQQSARSTTTSGAAIQRPLPPSLDSASPAEHFHFLDHLAAPHDRTPEEPVALVKPSDAPNSGPPVAQQLPMGLERLVPSEAGLQHVPDSTLKGVVNSPHRSLPAPPAKIPLPALPPRSTRRTIDSRISSSPNATESVPAITVSALGDSPRRVESFNEVHHPRSSNSYRDERNDQGDERVSCEVPSGGRDRLRVSLHRLRDATGRSQRRHGRGTMQTQNEVSPPTFPPKPSSITDSYPSPKTSVRRGHQPASPASIPVGPPRDPWYSPYNPGTQLPVHVPEPGQLYSLPFVYPQPAMTIGPYQASPYLMPPQSPTPFPGGPLSVDPPSSVGPPFVTSAPLPFQSGHSPYPEVATRAPRYSIPYVSRRVKPSTWNNFFRPARNMNQNIDGWRRGVSPGRSPSIVPTMTMPVNSRRISPNRMGMLGAPPSYRSVPSIWDRLFVKHNHRERQFPDISSPFPADPTSFRCTMDSELDYTDRNTRPSNRLFGARQPPLAEVRRQRDRDNQRLREKEERRKRKATRRDEREARRSDRKEVGQSGKVAGRQQSNRSPRMGEQGNQPTVRKWLAKLALGRSKYAR